MRVITKNEIAGFPIEKITKIILNKERESETIIEGHIINKDNAKVYLQGVEDLGKGRPLITKKFVEGSFLILLDKNNFDILVEASYEYVQAEAIKGNKVKDLYKFISEDKNKNKYLVEI
jgi:hypothetical protein